MKLPRWSAHPCLSQHQTVLQEYSSFTETILHKQIATIQLSRERRHCQMGITQHLGTLKSDPRQPPGRMGSHSQHVSP